MPATPHIHYSKSKPLYQKDLSSPLSPPVRKAICIHDREKRALTLVSSHETLFVADPLQPRQTDSPWFCSCLHFSSMAMQSVYGMPSSTLGPGRLSG